MKNLIIKNLQDIEELQAAGYKATSLTEIGISSTCGGVTITGLDFNKYKKIQIYGSIYNPSANISIISLCCNGDTTLTNYYTQAIWAGNTSLSADRNNDARCITISAGKCSFFNAIVGYDYNNIFRALSKYVNGDPSGNDTGIYAIVGSSNVTNITEFDLVSDRSDGLGAGSKIYVKQG